MLKYLKKFAQNESGAITTDFLVLTAVIVTMGLASMGAIATSSKSASIAVAAGIDSMAEGL